MPAGRLPQVHHRRADGVHPLSEPVPDHRPGNSAEPREQAGIVTGPGNTCNGFFQHYLYELVIKTLVQHNLFYMLHQFLQYHVLSDSKPLVSSNQELILRRRVCGSVDAPHLPLSPSRARLPRRAGYVHRFSVSLLNCVLSGLFAAVSGEHVPTRTPAVPGHAEGTKQA